ncbi:vWA domain-containing protein [Desulfobacula phenolica]|uniref:Predicted metal-dependent peptidase n=1 Tax=Desulfobacula phenolica TaxID=90732 RepID=A0A1H2K7V4_9BACT|nr:VWA-like domain-containing protein [Desulfobacula phenolica]SDU64797.1 Predicted metal-dependent peptidase [Desulfobacula phenolica]
MNDRRDLHAEKAGAEAKLHLAERQLLCLCPFHARLINKWKKVSSRDIDTIGVSMVGQALRLCYNPEFICGLKTTSSLVQVLMHEIYHVIFGHLFLDRTQFENPYALLIACEISANEFLDQEALPGKPILVQDFDLPDNESTLIRYRRLRLDSRCKNDLSPLDSHEGWANEDGGMSDKQKKILTDQISHTLDSLSLDEIRIIPDHVYECIKKIVDKIGFSSANQQQEKLSNKAHANLPWEIILHRFMSQERRYSFSWPSRRCPDMIGIIPGTRLSSKGPGIMVAIDTSGSMSMDVMDQILAEVNILACLAHRVVFVECDCDVTRVHPCFKAGDLETIAGRGGTDLRPPFELLDQYRVDLVVYFTDGEGPAPESIPSPPVIWCLTDYSSKSPAPWGQAIRLFDEDAYSFV